MSTPKQSRARSPGRKKAASRPEAEAQLARGNGETGLTQDERRRMVAEAAYYRALRRGFTAGGEIDDWLAAEREIEQQITSGVALSHAPASTPSKPKSTTEDRRPRAQ